MKTIIAFVAALFAAGCSSSQIRFRAEYSQTRLIESADIKKLPPQLTFGELVHRWGPPWVAGNALLYQTPIQGISLTILLEEAAVPEGNKEPLIEDIKVVSMYFVDKGSLHLHAWGTHILPDFDPFATPAGIDINKNAN